MSNGSANDEAVKDELRALVKSAREREKTDGAEVALHELLDALEAWAKEPYDFG